MPRGQFLCLITAIWGLLACSPASGQSVSGELKQWHAVTVTFTGPVSSETDPDNPFLDVRLEATFRSATGVELTVPGFFAGDGQGGPEGDKWQVRFCPPLAGKWTCTAKCHRGKGLAIAAEPKLDASNAVDGIDGKSVTFQVARSDKIGRDFRAAGHGLLSNELETIGYLSTASETIGKPQRSQYLIFTGSYLPGGMKIWIKGGPDIPENFLGYAGFDNTPRAGHRFEAHLRDWKPGNPDWADGKGKAIIGSLNYIASTGCNCVYFLPMNLGGDGNDTYPFISPDENTRYDLSKLAQWDIVFSHAQKLGIFLHFQLAETEKRNENFFGRVKSAGENGDYLTDERKLFYRELIARFAHHPGLQWNLGEENDFSTDERRTFARYIQSLDVYGHPVAIHTKSSKRGVENVYKPLLGEHAVTMMSMQLHDRGNRLGNYVEQWLQRSQEAGAAWVVSVDEGQRVLNSSDPDDGYPSVRDQWVWPIYLSGAGGFELYVKTANNRHSLDQDIEDMREMDEGLRYIGYALTFMQSIEPQRMKPADDLVRGKFPRGRRPEVLAQGGVEYAIYWPDVSEGTGELDLTGAKGKTFTLQWFDPVKGRWSPGSRLPGGDWVALPGPPWRDKPDKDWAARIFLDRN